MKSPFQMMFGPNLARLFCKHKGNHTEWGYKFGSGVCEEYCCKCGSIVRKVPLDDVPKETLEKLTRLFREDSEENQGGADQGE